MMLVSLILLPIKLICSACRLIFRCDAREHKMGYSCASVELREVRSLKDKLKHRSVLDKKLQNSAEKFFCQYNSGGVSTAVQTYFESWLHKIDQAHQDLINYIKPYLNDAVIQYTFINEKLTRQTTVLKDKYDKLKDDYHLQKDRYDKIIEKRAKTFFDEKNNVEQRNADLEKYCKYLETEKTYFQKHASITNKNNSTYEQLETIYMRKERQFKETLKTQNDLISELKRQLAECKMKQEILKIPDPNLRQISYSSSKEIPLSKQNIIQIENEKRNATEQHNLEKMYLQELHSVQREYQNKIYNLEQSVFERDQLLQNLHQQNKTLQGQISQVEGNLKQEWYNLEKNYKSQGTLIENLEKRLAYTLTERDTLKTQNFNLQQEIENQGLKIRNLNDEICHLRNAAKHLTVAPSQARSVVVQQDNQTVLEKKCQRENAYIHDALNKIEDVFENARTLEKEIREFSGTKKDKTFLHLQELLIRSIVDLDNVESEGNFAIRKRRKEVIQYVQALLSTLKEKT